jgi:hypothetical protein
VIQDVVSVPDELRVLAVACAVLAIPGWALLVAAPAWRRLPALQAWALALSLGVAFWPVLFTVVGVLPGSPALGRGVLLALLAVLALAALLGLRRAPLLPLRFVRLEQIALLVVAATVATRALVAHQYPFPAWSDSLHHVVLTELTARAGRLPVSMQPYFPVPLGRYHVGFYALSGVVQMLAEVPAHVAVTWVAQLLSGLCGLGVYLVLDRHVGRLPAVIGAVIAGLISHQPAFYVNWGRFTQLAAQTILLQAWLAVAAALRALPVRDGAEPCDDERASFAVWGALLVAGVFLLHLRIAVFLALLLGLTLLVALWRVRRDAHARRTTMLIALALLGAALALSGPRLLRAVAEYASGHWAAMLFQGGLRSGEQDRFLGDPEYFFAFSREAVSYLFADLLPLGALLVAALLAVLRGNLIARVLTAWSVLLLALAEAHVLKIPLLNVTNLGAVLILLYLPASVVVACGVAETLAWLRAGAGVQTAVLLAFLALGALGARDRVTQIEPSRFFVTPADLRAMRWLDDNAPRNATVAVRTTFWLPHAPHGIDAGSWIPYLTERRITVGPMIANLQPQFANWAVEMSRRVRHAADDDTEWVWLWKRGVRYAYLGALADPAEAVQMAKSKHLLLRYAEGGAYIFEVDPGVGDDG